MPELPEVEAVRVLLEPVMKGARFTSVVTLRSGLRRPFPADFEDRLTGQTIHTLGRRGKYLIAELSSGELLVMHLGMTGSFTVEMGGRSRNSAELYALAEEGAARHNHVVFHLSSGAVITFNDPRRFGSMDLVAPADLRGRRGVGGLGPEPLLEEFNAAAFARSLRGKKTSLKAALMDQRVVAGLGNIYVCEALYRARLSPKRRASSISTPSGVPRPTAHRLVAAIKRVLRDAIAHAAVTFRVYDREGKRCRTPHCPGHVRRFTQAGRSTFYCPICQK